MNNRAHQAATHLWQQAARPRMIVVTGNSMLPLLRAGDRVLVAPVNRPLRRGDIVVFTHENQLVIHRLIRFMELDHPCCLITKGDNGPSDPPVPLAQVVGIVIALQRADVSISLATHRWQFLGWLLAVTAMRPNLHHWLLRVVKAVGW